MGKLAHFEAKLATLSIRENRHTRDPTIFAGQNLEHILWPLMRIKPSLLPFLRELIQTGQIDITAIGADEINAQFLDLLALCKEASGAEDRRNSEAIYVRNTRSTEASMMSSAIDGSIRLDKTRQARDQRCCPEARENRWAERRMIVQRRVGSWFKSLPQGWLRVATISESNKADNTTRLYVYFTFIPYSTLNLKGLAVSFLSGLGSVDHPKAFHNIRCFNRLTGTLWDEIWNLMKHDDVDTLRQYLLEGRLTL